MVVFCQDHFLNSLKELVLVLQICYSKDMATKMKTKKKRINITAEPVMVEILEAIAKRDGVLMTSKTRDLIWRGIELEEDLAFEALAESRAKNHKGKWLTHEEVFGSK